ncbi:hypothetical protein GA0115235_126018 [Streptomyces sp. DpondAA-F4a]|nr:hypothetical protein GA0115235_126018 [Streptomyces sp. DpondAA-F4a]
MALTPVSRVGWTTGGERGAVVDRDVLRDGSLPGCLGVALGVDAADRPGGEGHTERPGDLAQVLAGGLRFDGVGVVAEVRAEGVRDAPGRLLVVDDGREGGRPLELGLPGCQKRLALGSDDPLDRVQDLIACGVEHGAVGFLTTAVDPAAENEVGARPAVDRLPLVGPLPAPGPVAYRSPRRAGRRRGGTCSAGRPRDGRPEIRRPTRPPGGSRSPADGRKAHDRGRPAPRRPSRSTPSVPRTSRPSPARPRTVHHSAVCWRNSPRAAGSWTSGAARGARPPGRWPARGTRCWGSTCPR